jgi:hypothetical protein
MKAVYINPGIEPTADPPEHRGVGSPIDAAKALIPVIDLADWLCGPGRMRRVGKEWAGRCPLPDHEDRSPSFAVNTEKKRMVLSRMLTRRGRGGSSPRRVGDRPRRRRRR